MFLSLVLGGSVQQPLPAHLIFPHCPGPAADPMVFTRPGGSSQDAPVDSGLRVSTPAWLGHLHTAHLTLELLSLLCGSIQSLSSLPLKSLTLCYH